VRFTPGYIKSPKTSVSTTTVDNRRAKTFSSEAARDSLIGTDTHPCPSQLMEQKELRAILRQAVLHLPPMRRRVFQLRFVEELPIKAIAKQINRSEGTVKTHISKAKAQLRELLAPYLKTNPLNGIKNRKAKKLQLSRFGGIGQETG